MTADLLQQWRELQARRNEENNKLPPPIPGSQAEKCPERTRERENVEWGWSGFPRGAVGWPSSNPMHIVARGGIVLLLILYALQIFAKHVYLGPSVKTNTHKHHHINVAVTEIGWFIM